MGFPRFTIDDYIITPEGEVINKRWNRKVKPQPNGKGYLRFSVGGRMKFVHRLVAEKYVPNPENKPQVNHKDGNKLNNRADNLEWATNQENRNHAVKAGLHIHGERCPWAKLTQADVDYLRRHPNIDDACFAMVYEIQISYVRAIRNHKAWK